MAQQSRLTSGLVLNVRDSGEADKRIAFLTPEYGRLSLLAKGVRRAKSRRSSALNPGNIIRCGWITKGEWHTLTEVIPQEPLLGPSANLERLRDFSVVLEMVYYLTMESIEQSDLYERTVILLRTIGQQEDYNRGWVRQQLLELAAEQGLAETATQSGRSVTKILEEALERPLRSFAFLTVDH